MKRREYKQSEKDRVAYEEARNPELVNGALVYRPGIGVVREHPHLGDSYSISVPEVTPGYGNAQKINKNKPDAYELAYANRHKSWAKRWLRANGLKQ